MFSEDGIGRMRARGSNVQTGEFLRDVLHPDLEEGKGAALVADGHLLHATLVHVGLVEHVTIKMLDLRSAP